MAFNRKEKLLGNIAAITTALTIEKEERTATDREKEILKNYCGFGGLKCVLRPCEKDDDIQGWNKSDVSLFGYVRQLHSVIRQHSKSEDEYRQYVRSLKQSVLSAFYTPPQVAEAIARSLAASGITINSVLDPSAGNGEFMDAFTPYTSNPQTAFELDLLTGRVLKALRPEDYILIKGFESIDKDMEGSFDVVSSNIPFGDFPTFDPAFSKDSGKARYQASRSVHNYFFLKAVDAAREGGIVAFVTSRGVMDSPQNKIVREWLMDNCNLVSAVRLPDNLFAENANTQVGSDLIILQKDTMKQSLSQQEESFIGTRTYPNGVHLNNYFTDFSNIISTKGVLGTDPYGKPAMEFFYEKSMDELATELSAKLGRDIGANLNAGLYRMHQEKGEHISEDITPSNRIEDSSLLSLYNLFGIEQDEIDSLPGIQQVENTAGNIPDIEDIHSTRYNESSPSKVMGSEPREYKGDNTYLYKKNTLVTDNGQTGYIDFRKERTKEEEKTVVMFHPIQVNATQIGRIRDYVPLRDAYLQLFDYEKSYNHENPSLRRELNNLYKDFTDKHGDLNRKENSKFILLDAHGLEMLALESFTNAQKQLADIFSQPVSFMADKTLEVKTPEEALAASLNKLGGVDLEYMSAISSLDEKELVDLLQGKIYYNPLMENFEVSSSFISGDVVQKADDIEAYIKDNPGHSLIDKSLLSLKSLRDATPEIVPFSELDFNFGERWIPPRYFEDYSSELLGTKIKIDYVADLDDFFIEAENPSTIEIREQYAITTAEHRKVSGLALLSHAIINTSPNITMTIIQDRKDVKVPDTEAIQAANAKIEEMRGGFMDWLNRQSPDARKELEDLYNRKFNSRVRPHYDGTFQTFPDLQLKSLGFDKPYDSQYDAIWMLKSNGGGIVDHSVGGGKTLTICIAAYEMKRLKMANKPLIIGLKANTHELAKTYSRVYPNAKILYPSENDFRPENRKRLFNNIKNNNWDAIVLTHDQFFKIPQSLEMQNTILQKELDSVEENLRVYERLTGRAASTGMVKGLEKRMKTLAAKLADVHFRMEKRRDDVVDFKDMGIDHIFVDESHIFKNLQFTTRYNRVSGLGNPEGSQRALNLLYAIRTIQDKNDKDLCATFLSGTTVSNSLVELYLLFKYLRPKALESQGIRTFDAWAAVFAKKTTDYEFTVTNEIKPKERFRYFKNVPELGRFYNEITDFRGESQIKLDCPETNIRLHNIPPTPEQNQFLKNLIDFAHTGDAGLVGRPELSYEERKAIGLIITDYAGKMALDMRLIDPIKFNDHPDNKASHCAAIIADYYKKYDDFRGTQFLFSDRGTWKPDQWNLFSEIKRKLVEDYNIPAHEIRFMQEAKNQKQREQFIDAMKNGFIRILGGSTAKLGTGVNAQDRAVANHNLDVPWKPSELEQRRGRSSRPGNWVAKNHAENKVDMILYASENSLDTYKFNLLQNKQLFINQLKTNSLNVRTLDEGGMSEDGGMNFSEFVAVLSGNTDLLDKVKLERKIAVLQGELRAHNRSLSSTQWRLKDTVSEIGIRNTRIEGMENDYLILNEKLPKNEDGIRPNPVRLDGFNASDIIAVGKKLNEINDTMETHGEFKKIGSLLDFKILVRTEGISDYRFNRFYIEGSSKYSYNNGNLASDPELAASNFVRALEKIPSLIDNYKSEIRKLEKDIPKLEEIINSPWKKEGELKQLKTQLDVIERRIKESLSRTETSVSPSVKAENKKEEKIPGVIQKHALNNNTENNTLSPKKGMKL